MKILIEKMTLKNRWGTPWWCSRLRIWYCHCSGMDLITGLGTSACLRCGQEKKKIDIQIGHHQGIGKMYRSKIFLTFGKILKKRSWVLKIDTEKNFAKKRTVRRSHVVQWVKDPTFSLQQLGFNPWSGNSICRGAAKEKKKKEAVLIILNFILQLVLWKWSLCRNRYKGKFLKKMELFIVLADM